MHFKSVLYVNFYFKSTHLELPFQYKILNFHELKDTNNFAVIPPTPAKEDNKEKFDFGKTLPSIDTSENARSVENLYRINRLENPQKGAELLFVSKLSDSRRLSIPVVLIPADGKIDSKFDSSDHVYRENLYKAASVSSLGNFGNIAAEPMPIIKNKEGKWYVSFIIIQLLFYFYREITLRHCSISFDDSL